jgi:hypothetical protein
MATYSETLRCGPYTGSFLVEDGCFVEVPGPHQTRPWSVANDVKFVYVR